MDSISKQNVVFADFWAWPVDRQSSSVFCTLSQSTERSTKCAQGHLAPAHIDRPTAQSSYYICVSTLLLIVDYQFFSFISKKTIVHLNSYLEKLRGGILEPLVKNLASLLVLS